jgi:hypothetical protein
LAVYGLRTAEPHHDGCPHWHLVIYGPARDVRYARRLMRVYALSMDGGEPGARRARFRAMPLKGGQAGASYAAKYIAKNIDGGGMEGERDSETGRKVSESARRVDAWAAAWGIRQFQFFGLPVVGPWRVLRKIREPIAAGGALEEARRAADESRWCDYCRVLMAGGIRLLKDSAVRLTQYGDRAAAAVIGIAEGGRRAWLNRRRWVLCWGEAAKKSAVRSVRSQSPVIDAKNGKNGASWCGFGTNGPGASWVDRALGWGFDLPWSGVNNCTRQHLQGVPGMA